MAQINHEWRITDGADGEMTQIIYNGYYHLLHSLFFYRLGSQMTGMAQMGR